MAETTLNSTDNNNSAVSEQVPQNKKKLKFSMVVDHSVLILGALFMLIPVLLTFTTSSHDPLAIHKEGLHLSMGGELANNYSAAMLEKGGFTESVDGMKMLWNSLLLGFGFAIGKILISTMAAFAIVYFRLRFATLAFWMIFTTLLLPLEVRILPTYEIVQNMGLANTFTGLIVPLVASATGTFFFRQYFMSVPEELVEAAKIDGAGPVKFFIDILLPLSKTMIAALFIIMFVYGWNQYLWPTLITSDENLFTLVRGIRQIILVYADGGTVAKYGQAMALAIVAIIPPVLIVVFFQSWFIKGLTESDK